MNSLKRHAGFAAKGIRALMRLSAATVPRIFLVLISMMVVIVVSGRSIHSVPLHNDEISWFFHIQFFEQVFIKHDVTSRFWYTYESYDHPHLSKYIFGAYMRLKDPSVFSARDRLEKKYGRWSFYFHPDVTGIRERIFAPYLYSMREANLFFVVGSCMLIGMIMYLLTGSAMFSVISLMIFTFNQFFMSVMVRATSDAQVIFFMLASFVFYVLYGRKKDVVWLAASSVCVGLAVSSKLTGALALYTYIAMELFWWGKAQQRFGDTARAVGVLVIVSASLWIMFNPTLYTQAIAGTLHYFDFRYIQLGKLQHAFPGVSLDTVPMRIHAVYCTVIQPLCKDEYFQGSLFPSGVFNIIAIVAGIVYLFIGMKDHKRAHMITSFGVYVLTTLFVSTMMMFISSDRYYTPVQICIFIVELVGVYGAAALLYRLVRRVFV